MHPVTSRTPLTIMCLNRRTIKKYSRFTKHVYKKPTYQLTKGGISCILLYTQLPQNWNVVSIDEGTKKLGEVLMNIGLFVMRKTALFGIDIVDIMVILIIVNFIRKMNNIEKS